MSYKDPEKWKEWNRQRHLKNAEDVRELKSQPCTDCGNTFPWYIMEFDHVPERGEKKICISKMGGSRSINAPSFLKELNKCDLVCANCHKIRTHERKQEANNCGIEQNLTSSPDS